MLAKINVIWLGQTHYLLFTEIEVFGKLKAQQWLRKYKWSYFYKLHKHKHVSLVPRTPPIFVSSDSVHSKHIDTLLFLCINVNANKKKHM